MKRGKRKEIVFGDRFALRYFVEEYGLDYDVAFPGCSEQTEVSVKTLTSLVDKVRELGAPVVLKNEMSNNGIAGDDCWGSRGGGVRVLFGTQHGAGGF